MYPFPRLAFFADSRIDAIDPLPTRADGNALWRVVTQDRGVCVVRHRIRNDTDVDAEAIAARLAAEAGIAPEVLAYEEGSTLVLEYLDGEHRSFFERDDLRRLAQQLRRLHAIEDGAEMLPAIDLRALITADEPSVAEAFGVLETLPVRQVLCHNDLNPRNLIWMETQVKMIDFEYAGLNDPYFDLAAVSVEFDLSKEAETVWMAAYWGASGWESRQLDAFKVLYRALWRQWEAKQ